MKFEISQNYLDSLSADVALLFAFKREKQYELAENASILTQNQKDHIEQIANFEQFIGKKGQVLFVPLDKKSLVKQVVVVGLGKKEKVSISKMRTAIAKATKSLSGKIQAVLVALPNDIAISKSTQTSLIVETIMLTNYSFSKYKKQKEGKKELQTILFGDIKKNETKSIETAIVKGEYYAQATIIARDLVNEPAEVATPGFLADLASSIGKSDPQITCKIIDKEEAKKMGMGGFLGIARASLLPPKFIVLTYTPKNNKSKRKLALIGKGITFDSGGINVKPGDHMQTMKMDMAGAAAVLGVFSVIAKKKPEFSVMGVIAATPNLISANSIVPGDVVTALNGKTIEILNTDAEGRVTMADSLSYAVKQGATEIIDLATLTGACMVALGMDIAGLFSNNKDVAKKLIEASEISGDKIWELPLPREYRSLNKSSVADIANIPSSRYGGAITAALFLQAFVNKTPWAHIDIAGPAFAEKPYEFGDKGGTGFGVRLLLDYIGGHK